MHALDVLGDPVRRRILELLAEAGELSAGEVGERVQEERRISRPAVSQHLRILREQGFTTVRSEGRRRLYALDARGPQEAEQWLSAFERFWLPPLDALGTELARGRRERRVAAERASAAAPPSAASAIASPVTPPSAPPATSPIASPVTPPSASPIQNPSASPIEKEKRHA